MLEELVRDDEDDRPIHGVAVDDDGPFVELVEQMLTTVSARLTVDTYTDPSAVLTAVRGDDAIEFVVSDYEMPRMNGLELLRELRADRPRLPFVLFTGKGSEEIASEAISAGVSDYVQKRSGREPYELLANRVIDHVEKVREREALERSREQFRRLVEQSVAGIALSQDGRFVYVNRRYAEMFGYEPQELRGRRALELVDERDHERVREHWRRREAGEVESIHYVARGVTKDGETVPVELHGSRVTFDGDPAVLGVIVRLDDVEATSRLLGLARSELADAAADIEDDRLERTLDLIDRAIEDEG